MHRVLENAVLYWLSREVNYNECSTGTASRNLCFERMCTPTIHLPLPNPLSQYIFYGNITIFALVLAWAGLGQAAQESRTAPPESRGARTVRYSSEQYLSYNSSVLLVTNIV